ncbi:dihydroxyacetone synthase [Wickerhamomyces ciferrii]|uniref:Transketolase n=1 Tax=Wickerhamomyces ciferrii (strain ATCC 14091 / BCRC 22168 / CBS 111 / JCM 3599 / NBRC 0793 / NRRL Y-1031 F-60-10) TaxID=1206466 RepID=K0KRF5_WICCF|nr:dihydroxyacetone synthase [Wickerhamomyces ciferrii]CCH43898.1 dihydroxyacetone synthase [Wickerhamomyces ciferrii]
MTATEDIHDLTLKSIRVLIADLVQQFNGGHPGGAMGMAAIGIALWKYTLEFSPNDPGYFNRDRFVLSNGHTCLFQYVFQHLIGYKHMTMDQLKSYHSSRLDSLCPGHPEIEIPGIEITTGALGQGISNAVGLAIASKNLQETYNKPGFPVVSNHTFCMVGDACLQEGVTMEAVSLAGHLGLNNLTVIYDNNQISCDGSVDLTNTEDINAKFKATNWNVIEVFNGSEDVLEVAKALAESKLSTDKPTLINVHTNIGIGSNVENNCSAHGAAFGEEEVDRLHIINGFDPGLKYHIPAEVYEFFGDLVDKGDAYTQKWSKLVAEYVFNYPELGVDFQRRVNGELPNDWKNYIPSKFSASPTPSRASSGSVVNPLAKNINNFIVGSADLSPSVNLIWDKKVDFQNPQVNTSCGINGDYSGRYVHYGIREHAMAAISNGIAAFNKGTFIPVTSTFLIFYLYAAPAVRYGALSDLKVIHVATHDSIGMGEDGPTHQPIEIAALFRSMPNLNYIRPCDSEEVAGAWEIALEANGPTILSLSRHKLNQYPANSKRELVKKGAYIFKDIESPVLNIIGVGAEMGFAYESAELLTKYGLPSRVISFPSQKIFEEQSTEYKRSVLQRGQIPTIVIEAYAPNGWERYANAGFSMHTFGKSLPGNAVYEYFGYKVDSIVERIKSYMIRVQKDKSILWEFQDLNC